MELDKIKYEDRFNYEALRKVVNNTEEKDTIYEIRSAMIKAVEKKINKKEETQDVQS